MININELHQLTQAATPGPWVATTVVTSVGVCHKVGPFPGKTIEHPPRHACMYVDYDSADNPADCEIFANAAFIAAASPTAISELLDRLESAEQERDWHAERCEDAMNECDALRAAVRHEADCVEAAKAEIDALRAKIERADRLEKVESALSDLLNDLEERAKWNLEASQRVVACGNGVYVRAKAALEESK